MQTATQLQPMAGHRQTRNSLPVVSQPRREKTTTNGIIILLTIQVCQHCTYCSMHEQWFNLCIRISLAFMIKELSYHALHDVCHKQSEFSDDYLVYYPPIILKSYMPADNPYVAQNEVFHIGNSTDCYW